MRNTIESIKETVKLEDLCREYGLDLKQSGSTYQCLCPFHHENNPSFTIYPDDNRYYCFGCDEHGDVIEFVKKKEGIPFNEALAILCERGGFKMPAKVNEKSYKKQKIVDEILKTASIYYQLSLSEGLNPEAAIPLRYLRQRSVEIHSLGNYRIGFAPNNDHLLSYLKIGFGYKDEDIIESGLAYKNNIGNLCPAFINRFMFPFVKNDRIVYFTGRSLGDDDRPKYKHLRTGEHVNMDIYNQDSLNSGNKEIHVTEGVFDCILAEQEGLPTIATCGPSMKESQIKRFKDKSVFIVFDNDQNDAGKERSIKLASQMYREGIEAKIVDLPKGIRKSKMDLAEFLGTRSKEDFLDIRDESPCLIDYMLKEMANSPQRVKIKHVKEDIFPLLFDMDDSNSASRLETVKEKLGFKTDVYNSLKKEFRDRKRRYQKEKETRQALHNEVYEMTAEEKEEALKYLKNPKLVEMIQTDFRVLGVVGEESNALSLYLFSLTRKTEKPISAVVFGEPGSGKSHLIENLINFIPDEDVLDLTSASPKSFEHANEKMLKHKIIIIQEIQGMSEVEPIVRQMQSEGKLARLIATKDEDSGEIVTIKKEVECPSCIITTTTRDRVHPENSTRIFELYTNQSAEQTAKINELNREKATITWKLKKKEFYEIQRVHKNIQRLIVPHLVDVKYANFIDFPEDSNRYRRDLPRFLKLIEAVALLRQYHKQILKAEEGIEYIGADLTDYEIAYTLGMKLLASTLSAISERAKDLFRVILALEEDRFTWRDVKNKAKETKVQVPTNRKTRKNMLESLEDVGAIRTLPEKEGSAYVYQRLMSSLEELEETPERVIPSPEELEEMIRQEEQELDEIF